MSRENLAHHVDDRRIAVNEGVRAGVVCRERKEEQARDLLASPCMPHIGFDLRQRDPPDIPGPHIPGRIIELTHRSPLTPPLVAFGAARGG